MYVGRTTRVDRQIVSVQSESSIMAFLQQWKRLNFFDKEVVKTPGTSEIFTSLKDIDITACASGRGQVTLGDSDGNLFFLDRNLDISEFRAYELRVTHLCQLKQHNILVSIGQDEPGINPIIKVWNLDKQDKMRHPTCSRITRALPGSNQPSQVSALTVSETLTMMAIGFQDGSVTLIRGDVTRDRHNKFKTIYQDKTPVTGLGFRHTQRNTVLFVATETSVSSFNLSGKDPHREVLDLHGCPLRCSIMSDATQDNQFVMGREDAVYFYQPDGRGPCLAFEGQKTLLYWYRGYLVVVTKDSKMLSRNLGASGQQLVMDTVTVYDIQNKFIAYLAPVPEVLDVFQEWGSLYVLGGDRKLYHLQEKDTQTKLEILFKKNLYSLAINLAKSQHYDYDGLIDIFTQYGDHLYSKGDHDGAISQYIRTIGHLEPSYVIRKFLDAQRIHNLTAYLQALHKQSLANEDHTTLLLNCYTKLKDNSKLDEFIMTKDKEVDFDVETAIKVCRQAGYYKHALFLAEKHSQHDWYLKVQLEDIKDYQKALTYIAKLEFFEAMDNMKKYGKTLMSEVPRDTTDLLKILCTDYKPSDKPLIDANMLTGDVVPKVQKANAEEFIHIFVNNSGQLMEFLEHMVKVQPDSSHLIYNTLLELYLHDMAHEGERRNRLELHRKAMDLLQTSDALYDIDQALVLCQMHNFKQGILFLYEKSKLYQQILHYHMENNEYDQVIDTCKRHGTQDPNLWVQTLSYFARKEENCKQYIVEVLSQIDRYNLLPPLMVIQTLAHNSSATLSVVKDYIIRRLQQENDQITEDERLVKQYREETEKMRRQMAEMKTSAKIFQVSKCSICNHNLELPSVHFLCQHSYHQHCFESYAENDLECPACASENHKVMDIIRAQEQSKDLHEQFHRQLEKSQDGFSVVADYFGRGVFNRVTLLTDTFPSSPKKLMPSQTGILPAPMQPSRITQAAPARAARPSPVHSQPISLPGTSSTQLPPGRTQTPPQPRSAPSPAPGFQMPTARGASQSFQQEKAKQPQSNPAEVYHASPSRLTPSPNPSVPKSSSPATSHRVPTAPAQEYNPFLMGSGAVLGSARPPSPATSSPAQKTSSPSKAHSYNPQANPFEMGSSQGVKDNINPFTGRRDSPSNPFQSDGASSNPFEEEEDKNNPFFN
ncbi:vacuolar protein sorting-associated protein 11 homolog isoform X2 [Acanthaster planci]|uniref:Vacuolar protein sorting-associated protein 11 homolog isoform X2 n=1 Tax=Acanthaster planci TaxID=133434 RepID=A0A8B7YD23_ACAPL|nr:vacuolar protein sorting-associated protein 11 homolog isoform X2 [Acanthaster planci]